MRLEIGCYRCFKHLHVDNNHDVLQIRGQNDLRSLLCSHNSHNAPSNISRLKAATFCGMLPSSGCSNLPRSPSVGHRPTQKSFWHRVEPRLATPLKDVEGVGIVSDVGHVARAMQGPSCSTRNKCFFKISSRICYIIWRRRKKLITKLRPSFRLHTPGLVPVAAADVHLDCSGLKAHIQPRLQRRNSVAAPLRRCAMPFAKAKRCQDVLRRPCFKPFARTETARYGDT